MTSVFPEWMAALPMQQQSVLLLGARGPDGIAKAHPCKDVVRAYRATVLKAAYYGRSLRWGEKADGFMSLDLMADNQLWAGVLKAFFDTLDDLPHHYYLHLVHGAQILGYRHPDVNFRARWADFYWRCCNDMHLTPETADQMEARLADWSREHWDDAA